MERKSEKLPKHDGNTSIGKISLTQIQRMGDASSKG
jgi:hypothetical protein